MFPLYKFMPTTACMHNMLCGLLYFFTLCIFCTHLSHNSCNQKNIFHKLMTGKNEITMFFFFINFRANFLDDFFNKFLISCRVLQFKVADACRYWNLITIVLLTVCNTKNALRGGRWYFFFQTVTLWIHSV